MTTPWSVSWHIEPVNAKPLRCFGGQAGVLDKSGQAGKASARTCPHDEKDRLLVSGTKLRKWLSEGDEVPAEFSRPEVLKILRDYYATIDAADRVEVKLTGHSAR